MWTPTKEWLGQSAYIIGGGSSLQGFDFSLLKGRNTIGCNDAFKLGKDIVQICAFGDGSWFQRVKWDLEKFGGRVVSFSPAVMPYKLDWMHKMQRIDEGLSDSGSKVAWNYSTGAASLNLALLMGAGRIFLLGFDLNLNQNGKSHWHGFRAHQTKREAFMRFGRGFESAHSELAAKFPGVEVFNVTDGSSKLPAFPRISFEEFKKQL